MVNNRRRKHVGLFLILLFGMLQACSHIGSIRFSDTPSPTARKEAADRLSSLRDKNQGLRSIKGIGRIEFSRDGKTIVSRAAWIGVPPHRFRVEILSPTGQPVISIAADDQQVFYRSHTDSAFYQTDQTDATLEKLTAIPITFEDIIQLLCGRIPLRPYDDAFVIPNEGSGATVLTLENRWTGAVEKIYLDDRKTSHYKVEMFGFAGSLDYRAVLDNTILADGFRLPSGITVSSEGGNTLTLQTDRYISNEPIEESMFTLPPPDGRP